MIVFEKGYWLDQTLFTFEETTRFKKDVPLLTTYDGRFKDANELSEPSRRPKYRKLHVSTDLDGEICLQFNHQAPRSTIYSDHTYLRHFNLYKGKLCKDNVSVYPIYYQKHLDTFDVKKPFDFHYIVHY